MTTDTTKTVAAMLIIGAGVLFVLAMTAPEGSDIMSRAAGIAVIGAPLVIVIVILAKILRWGKRAAYRAAGYPLDDAKTRNDALTPYTLFTQVGRHVGEASILGERALARRVELEFYGNSPSEEQLDALDGKLDELYIRGAASACGVTLYLASSPEQERRLRRSLVFNADDH